MFNILMIDDESNVLTNAQSFFTSLNEDDRIKGKMGIDFFGVNSFDDQTFKGELTAVGAVSLLKTKPFFYDLIIVDEKLGGDSLGHQEVTKWQEYFKFTPFTTSSQKDNQSYEKEDTIDAYFLGKTIHTFLKFHTKRFIEDKELFFKLIEKDKFKEIQQKRKAEVKKLIVNRFFGLTGCVKSNINDLLAEIDGGTKTVQDLMAFELEADAEKGYKATTFVELFHGYFDVLDEVRYFERQADEENCMFYVDVEKFLKDAQTKFIGGWEENDNIISCLKEYQSSENYPSEKAKIDFDALTYTVDTFYELNANVQNSIVQLNDIELPLGLDCYDGDKILSVISPEKFKKNLTARRLVLFVLCRGLEMLSSLTNDTLLRIIGNKKGVTTTKKKHNLSTTLGIYTDLGKMKSDEKKELKESGEEEKKVEELLKKYLLAEEYSFLEMINFCYNHLITLKKKMIQTGLDGTVSILNSTETFSLKDILREFKRAYKANQAGLEESLDNARLSSLKWYIPELIAMADLAENESKK